MSEEKPEVFSCILTTTADSPYSHPAKPGIIKNCHLGKILFILKDFIF